MDNNEVIKRLKWAKFRIDCATYSPETLEALDIAIKALEERQRGELLRKEDVIHSIAKQYSEHNELVPIWLSIADMKGGAE